MDHTRWTDIQKIDNTILTSWSWYDTMNYFWEFFWYRVTVVLHVNWCIISVIPRGNWYAHQLIHNICVRTWIGWYVCQPMHDICIRIYVSLCHILSCDGPPIELPLVTSRLTPIVITSKTEITVNKTSLHVKTLGCTRKYFC